MIPGDVFNKKKDIDKLVNDVVESNAAIGLISANVQNPFGYGRIKTMKSLKIIEELMLVKLRNSSMKLILEYIV